MQSRKPSISVFFPCYNDEKVIVTLVEKAINNLKKVASDWEVIVIDDASSDNSREVLTQAAKKYRELKLIFHPKNRGYGGALKSGFKTAKYDLVFYTDGDGQYDVNELPLLVSLMTRDVNFINGIKMERQDAQHRIFFGNLHKFFNRWLFWLPVYDVDCDFRLIRKSLLDKIKLNSNSGSICIELVKKAQRAGAKFREVSVHHYERKYGQSQFFRLDKIASTYLDIAKLWLDLNVFGK
ncbi:MAG: Glycosyl transferase family protein [Microgenomates group bacterium Gr01-1014_5]|nr:MAG: Glycosyl transferase family protein [Microgenomates group bacterium Gr01-1014_5]